MKLKELYPTCTIIVICAIIATIQAASALPTISVEPSFQTVSSGENFTVDIYVDQEGNATAGAAYVLYFNNTLLSATSLVSGTFFGGYSVNTYGEGINNSAGTIDYGEAIQGQGSGGVTTDGTLTTITFQAIADHGTSELRFDETWTELSDPDGYPITMNTGEGSVRITGDEPPTPFLISGYVCYENSTPCNSPLVNITNLNTHGEWQSETSCGSNYYQISLSSGIDLNATEVLRFDATDGTSTSVTEHTVTQAEVGAGGFEYNITLELPSSDTTVSIGSAKGSVGDSVNVSINITDAPSIGAMGIRVTYNASILGATNVVNGSMIESLPAPLVAYHIGYMDVNISFVTYPEAVNGDGELFIVTFDVVGGNAGDSSPLNLGAEAYATDLSPVALETVDGVVTVIDDAPDPAPSLVTYTISNTMISPNGDGVMDDTEIDVEFSEPVDAAILIEDATGVIRTLYTGSGVTDPDSQTWDGTDDGGNIVADGTYQVNVTMDDGVNPVVYDNTGSITVMYDTTTTSISIPDVLATGRITVPITIENVSNVGSCQLTLDYDPDVVIALDASSDFDSLFANFEDAASGSVSIIAYQTSNPGLNGDVVVANVTFIAVGNSGSSTPLDLEVTTLTDATPDCNPIPYTIRNGSFTMFLNGDVNGDSRVDVADCMFLAKHLLGVGGFETIVEAAADVNGNGEIEASDCMYLAKHLAGMAGFEVLK